MSPPAGSRHPGLQNAALAVASMVVFVLGAEGALRLSRVDLAVPGLEVRHGVSPLLTWAFTDAHFVRDPELMWAPRPSFPPFNEQGYRGQVVALPKPAGELRILAMGDSNTLDHASSWANDLSATLDPRLLGRERTTVVNAGVYGYTSHQGRLRLERFRDFEPDLVLISFGGNDPALNVATDRALRPSAWQAFLDRWSPRLRLVALIRYAGHRLARRPRPPAAATAGVPRVSVEDYRENLRAMIHSSRRMGARPILLTRPSADDVYAAASNAPVRPYYQATFDVGTSEKVPVIDLHRMVGRHWALYNDKAHFNARGHSVAGALVSQAITSIIERGSYTVDEVHYRPEDAAYEQLLDDLYGKVSPSMPPEQARSAFLAAVAGRWRRMVFDLAAPPPSPSWRLEGPNGNLEVSPHRLCVTNSSSMVLDVPADGDSYLFLWFELDHPTEAAVRLFWDTGAGFSEASVAAAPFVAGPFKPQTHRFSRLLPRRVVRVRLDVYPSGATRTVCFHDLFLERVEAGARPEGVVAR